MQTAKQVRVAKEVLTYAYELLKDENAVPRYAEFTPEELVRAQFAADCMREDAARKQKRLEFMF